MFPATPRMGILEASGAYLSQDHCSTVPYLNGRPVKCINITACFDNFYVPLSSKMFHCTLVLLSVMVILNTTYFSLTKFQTSRIVFFEPTLENMQLNCQLKFFQLVLIPLKLGGYSRKHQLRVMFPSNCTNNLDHGIELCGGTMPRSRIRRPSNVIQAPSTYTHLLIQLFQKLLTG